MPRRGPPQTPKNTIEQNRKISDRQTIAVTDLLSEGPIYGLVDGQASVFLNDDRAAPLGQAGGSRSRTALRINLTNGSTSATITNGGANPLTISANGKKYLTIRGGAGTQTVVASNSAAGTDDGAIVTTLTTTGGASFFTDAMVSAPGATPETHVPFRLTRTSALHGVTDEGAGEGVLTTRTNGTTAEFTAGSGAPGGIWVPEGTYTAEVDTVVEVASVSGVTVTLASAWGGTTGSYKFDISGTIVTDSDVVSQTQISTYEGVTTQFRVGTLSQTPFAGEGGVGSTAISNSGPSAGGSIEQSNNFGGSQAPKELIGSSSSGFNLTASQLQEVDEARVVIAYANGFYAVSGKGKNKHTFIRYRFQIAIKKIGSGSFETPITVSPSSHTVHSGLYTNATTFAESFDLNQYRPFADFKIIIDRVDSHENPGFDGVGETFHDWQNVTAASVSNVTCIIKDIVTHPYSAMAKTTFSTKQFQGMPSRTYHLRGLKVQVPSNYVTREEAANGVANYNRDVSTGAITNTYQDWDGAFQLNKVYTNNPAWVFYDILTNNRYGLGDFLKATDIDKYALFKIARYCDELVDDGKGGTEPRFTANLYFTKQTDAFKVLKDMATIFRGMLYFIDGQILPVMDSPSGPIYNFSKANVIDGQFSYETTGTKTRVNQVIVTWVNPDANYKAEPLIVEDRQDIVKQNRVITENAVAMGAITEGQALRFGRWKLWTAANQREIVSFSTALNASFLVPGDIINIQDSDRNTLRYSGRVSNTGTRNTSTVPIDSSVTINGTSSYELSIIFVTPGAFATSDVTVNGIAYEAGQLIPQAFLDDGAGGYSLQNIDTVAKSVNAKATANATENLILNFGDTTRVEKRTLNNSAGATTSLTVSSAFTATPDAEAIWGLTEVNSGGDTLTASPKQYKILSMSEKNSNIVEIAAVEFYNEKFDAVDGDFNTYVADTVYPAVTATDTVPPVQSVFATNQMTNIALGEVLELHWIPPTEVGGVAGVYEHLAGFEISHPFIDRENHVRVMDPETTHFTFKDLPIGTHKIAVKVINVLDNLSEPEIITVTVSDKFDEPIPRTQKGIPYTGDVNAGMQMSNAGSFSFKNSTYTFKHPSTRGRDTIGNSLKTESFTQDCSGMVATGTTEGDVTGEFLTDHYYLLLDNSEVGTLNEDKIKLLRYHKPNGVGTPYFYDSGNGSSTTRFGSALTGTFTKAANASKVIGSGTNFTGQIQQGDVLKLGSEEIEVSAVESNTVLYLAKATGTAHSGVQGFIPNIRIDYINDCIIARAFKKSSDNSFNFVPYAKTDGEVKSAPDVIADGSIAETQIADDAITADKISVSSLSDISTNLGTISGAATTQNAGDSSTNIATTAFVTGAISDLVDSAPGTLNTLNELAAALGDNENFSTSVTTSLASKAPLADPTFTGTVSGVTKAMVGLGNVDNTSVADIRSGTTASNVGLGNVTNESKATMFANPTFTGTVSGVTKAMVGLTNVEDKSSATIRGELTSSNVTTALGFTPGTSNLALGTTSTTALAGNTSIVTSVGVTAPIQNTGSGSTPGIAISAATTSAAGSMSAADKTKLDALVAAAITTDGSTPSLASGISAGQVRGLINAGTSSLAVGTSASDALAGDSLSVTKLDAIYANFGTMAAEVANIGTLKTDFLDADKVITRDLKVGPTTSVNSGSLVSGRTYTITDSGTGSSTTRFPGATSNDVGVVFTATGTGDGAGGGVARDHTTVANIATSTTAASAMAVDEIFIITNLGSIGNNAWSTLAGTTTNSALFTYRTYAVGDIIKVAVANGSLGSGAGIKLTGTGSHLTSAGDFLLGDVAAEKFLAFSTATNQLSLSKNIQFDSSRVELGVVASDQFVLQDIAGKFLMVARDDTVRLYHDDAPQVFTQGGGLEAETGSGFISRYFFAKDTNGIDIQSTFSGGATSQTLVKIKNNGDVGLGTTAPDTLLHVSATSPHIDIGPQGGNRGKIGYHDLDVYIGSTSSTGEIHFKNNISSTDAPHSSGDTKMVITDSAVLLGTTSTTPGFANTNGHAFHVGDASHISRDQGVALVINRGTNEGEVVQVRSAGTHAGGLGIQGSDITIGNDNVGLRLGYAGLQNIVPVDHDNNDLEDNLISLGHANSRFHDIFSGGTIQLHGDNKIATTSGDFTLDVVGEITLDADTSGTVRFKDGGTQYASMFKTGTAGLTIDSPGNMTFDSAGDIRLDAAGSDISLLAAGTEFAHLSNSSGDFLIQTAQGDKDIIFKGVDGSSVITALTLDMSEAGAATFNNNITAFSDRRLKDNIKTLDSQKTYQMRGVSYTRDGVPGSGVIAQELEEVAPELVLTNDKGIKSVDYGRTIGYLIETIKDLKKEVEDLKDDIASLRK